MGERKTTFAKSFMGLNRKGDIGNMSMNISPAWGTNRESDENSLRTRENEKKKTH
jgi:hypothetical protein